MGFLFETMNATLIGREFTSDEFERDFATEVRVVCEVDLAHAARAPHR